MSLFATSCTCEETCEPFGHPTQVSTQVQLESTCDYLPVRLAKDLRWDYWSMDSFAFLICMYESYLSSFNDWQSRLIIARPSTFVAPFWSRAVFLGLIPPRLSMTVVVQSPRYCWAPSILNCLSQNRGTLVVSFSIYHQCFKQTFSILFCFAQPNRKHVNYKKGRQIMQQIVEGIASNNRVYLQESEKAAFPIRQCY